MVVGYASLNLSSLGLNSSLAADLDTGLLNLHLQESAPDQQVGKKGGVMVVVVVVKVAAEIREVTTVVVVVVVNVMEVVVVVRVVVVMFMIATSLS